MMLRRRILFAQMLLSGFVSQLLGRRGEAYAENVQYEYDGLGRLARVVYGDGTTIVYTYDAAGNRATLVQSPSPPPPAPQGSLSANPTAINQGASSTLTWSSTNATTGSINQGVGAVTPVSGGSVTVSPSATTTYTLTLTGPGGQITPQATVTVNSPPPPPQGTFSANPASITQGNSSSLSWTSTNATGASIDNGVGTVTPVAGGSAFVSPAATTTYTLTLTGPGGQITRQTTVTVTQPPGFNATIPITGTGPVNLRTLADAAGYNGAQNATVVFTLASAVTIGGVAGAPNGGIAIDTGSWPSGFTIDLDLQVSGKVFGGGGRGGAGSSTGAGAAGGAGGDAVYCRVPIDITVASGGQIKGGGGGGGGGAYQLAGGGSVRVGGDGGGGGFPNGAGGAGSNGTAGDAAVPGAPGTVSGGGLGGSGGGPVGGNGGNGGAVGGSGASFSALGGVGGVGGYAIRKNGNTVNVTNNGTIAGAVG